MYNAILERQKRRAAVAGADGMELEYGKACCVRNLDCVLWLLKGGFVAQAVMAADAFIASTLRVLLATKGKLPDSTEKLLDLSLASGTITVDKVILMRAKATHAVANQIAEKGPCHGRESAEVDLLAVGFIPFVLAVFGKAVGHSLNEFYGERLEGLLLAIQDANHTIKQKGLPPNVMVFEVLCQAIT